MPASARLSVRGIGVARERQHVHRGPQLLEPLLRRDPEPLLLVHHDQAQVLERDVLRQQPVRPDDDVHAARREPRDRRLLLLRAHEPRQQLDGERERREPLRERGEVLPCQHGRRHEDRDLLAVLGRLERGPQRHLGLAVAHVAHDQPVHRLAGLHVDLDLDGGPQLVRRLLVRERRLHLGLPRRVERRRRSPSAASRFAYRLSSSSARSLTALRTRCLVRSQSVPPRRDSCGLLAAGVAADRG